jgi:shikimate kinase
VPSRVVIVGPPAAGKSTVAKQLTNHLSLQVVAVDQHRAHYYGPAYRDDLALTAFDRGGAASLHSYESPFELRAFASLLESGVCSVIDTGGGLLLQRNPGNQARLRALLAGVECVILCMPGGKATPRADVIDELVRRHTARAAADPFVERWLTRGGVEILEALVDAAQSYSDICNMMVDTSIDHQRETAPPGECALGASSAAVVDEPAYGRNTKG